MTRSGRRRWCLLAYTLDADQQGRQIRSRSAKSCAWSPAANSALSGIIYGGTICSTIRYLWSKDIGISLKNNSGKSILSYLPVLRLYE